MTLATFTCRAGQCTSNTTLPTVVWVIIIGLLFYALFLVAKRGRW